MAYKTNYIIRFKKYLLKTLGDDRSKKLLSRYFTNIHKLPDISLPSDLENVKSLLIILPLDMMELTLQMKNLSMLMSRFGDCKTVFLCEENLAPFVSGFQNSETITFQPEEKDLFSPEWKKLYSEVSDLFDLCVMLEKNPDLSLLMLAAKTNAPIRVGYKKGNCSPFLNVCFNQNETEKTISERNCFLASTLGAKNKKANWSISKTTTEALKQVLKEHSLPVSSSSSLIGIDLYFLSQNFEKGWVEDLIKEIKKIPDIHLYSFGGINSQAPLPSWARESGIKILPPLSVPRTTALIALSRTIITGKTTLFGMCSLLSATAIGIFEEEELRFYCKGTTSKLKGIGYCNSPDHSTIEKIILFLNNPVSKKKTSGKAAAPKLKKKQ
ncbi:hypothetical protein CHISP_0827 [Chitinispirillum alkaliphilum]|nr:hypothetical protein CHISP_0827 [Chitinispirillum alkaliphilum]